MMNKRESKEIIPEVLIIGAGIAGMQAALDIGDKGFKVHLVEKDPSIGGHMAQLDKTFPTLDCAACTITPKMVDTANHPNIDLLTYSEVVGIEGKAGDYKVTIKKKPRYVDLTKCTGCGDCAVQCPVSLPNEFDMGLGKRKAIYAPFPQAVPLKYTMDRRGVPPCRATCPLHVNPQGYVALVSQGKFKEALALVKEKNPFPGITGRICTRPCEGVCRRKDVDKSVAIDALKRFLADRCGDEKTDIPISEHNGKNVAIVGAGPAGLCAAHDLRKMGYGVTIYEALPVAGGMLAVGIPAYRLPRSILNKEVEDVLSMGVELKLNTPIGPKLSLDDLKSQGYKAIFVATGAHQGRKLGLEGEDARGVMHAIEFLRKVALGDSSVKVGKKVIVVGGGNAAIDAARTALRLGSREVIVAYRRTRNEMPAQIEEIEEAEEEGIKIEYLTAPAKLIVEGGAVQGMECYRMELKGLDAAGRPKPVPIPGSEFKIEADMIIPAISQSADLSFLTKEEGFKVSSIGIEAEPLTLETGVEGIFAGGDLVTGPQTYIEAMAAGRKAAISIDRYLKGEDLREGREQEGPQKDYILIDVEGFEYRERASVVHIPLERRKKSFDEVSLGLREEDVIEEAKRCINCGGCSDCGECSKYCQPKAIVYTMKEEMVELHVGAIIVATGFDPFNPKRKPEFGYGIYPNVLHGLEVERLCSASGPTNGEILIQGMKPKDVVFIHCVGSRDKTVGNEYCSRVCCMYTAKQAHLVRDKVPEANITVLYMDVRAFGKGFEEFYERVQEERIIYRRANPSEIYRKNGKLRIRGEDTLLGEPFELEADLVVLASGLVPRKEDEVIQGLLGLEKSSDQFYAEAPGLDPIVTKVEGVFLAGCCQGPRDIPDTVAHASGAASLACAFLARGRQVENRT
jgi:heterodisulfide reductase subunit A